MTGSDAIYVSANAGPSTLAGKGCNENYFVASWQNDTLYEMASKLAQQDGYKARLPSRAELSGRQGRAERLQARVQGRDRGRGLYPLARPISRPRLPGSAAGPDVVYQFHPGESGIAFVKQYQQAGLGKIPMVLAEPASDAVIPEGAWRSGDRDADRDSLGREHRQSRQQGLCRGMEGEISGPPDDHLCRAGLPDRAADGRGPSGGRRGRIRP